MKKNSSRGVVRGIDFEKSLPETKTKTKTIHWLFSCI